MPSESPTSKPTHTREPATSTATSSISPRPTRLAPGLVEPADGASVVGCETQIEFRWTSLGDLVGDEYYVLSVEHQLGTDEIWTKTTNWSIQDIDPFMGKSHNYLCGLAPNHWHVLVKERAGTKPDGQPSGEPRSAQSEMRTISWRPSDPSDGNGSSPPRETHEPPWPPMQAQESPGRSVGFGLFVLLGFIGLAVGRRTRRDDNGPQ